jgi:signal transduction histidine kinase
VHSTASITQDGTIYVEVPSAHSSRLAWLVLGGALVGLYVTSLHSYLLFHSLAEIFSIVVAAGIFMVAWNSRRFVAERYLLFLGIASLFVASIDVLHTLSYEGMGVLPGDNANLAAQLWIGARFLEGVSLLALPWVIGRHPNTGLLFAAYTAAVGLLVASIFVWRIFPACFVEGVGLTPFKKISEYVISLILVGALAGLYARRRDLEGHVFRLLSASILLTILSEVVFTFYTNPFSTANLVGHLLKVTSFYLIYRAIIATGLVKPYSLLFRSLKLSEEELHRANVGLERRVEARTAELRSVNERLQREIEEKRRAEQDLIASRDQLRSLATELVVTEERERRALARDLHDSVAQLLALSKLEVEDLRTRTGDGAAATTLDNVRDHLLGAIAQTRTLMFNLSPPALYARGLGPALENLGEQLEKLHGISITLADEEAPPDLAEDLRILLYRAVRELLLNVVKHARAGEVTVSLRAERDGLTAVVADDGVGFEAAATMAASRRSASFGLFSIRERLDHLGGGFQVDSTPGRGTRVTLTVPLASTSD